MASNESKAVHNSVPNGFQRKILCTTVKIKLYQYKNNIKERGLSNAACTNVIFLNFINN